MCFHFAVGLADGVVCPTCMPYVGETADEGSPVVGKGDGSLKSPGTSREKSRL